MATKKILIVEDDIKLQEALRETFINEGLEVAVASDGQQGLEAVKSQTPDLVLIDILMPKMDGISMAREMKKLEPVPMMIFLTNLSDIEHISEASETAYADYIVKSEWSIADIVKRVKERLGLA